MANSEQVAKLLEGPEEWNRWKKRPSFPELDGANLAEAKLNEANLIGAHLAGAHLTGADLHGADLKGVDLAWANLTLAKLNGANLRGAELGATVLGATNLSEAKGLDTCIHHGASIIDHLTLAKSGPLPLAFLRGCGLPDVLIDYLPSLLNQPIQF